MYAVKCQLFHFEWSGNSILDRINKYIRDTKFMTDVTKEQAGRFEIDYNKIDIEYIGTWLNGLPQRVS
jgi:hypothetical protein